MVAGFDRGDDIGMRQLHAGRIARGLVIVEPEGLTFLEHDGIVFELADSELGALQIDQDADRAFDLFLDPPDAGDGFGHQLMAGMAHIDTEDIGPGAIERLDCFFLE